MTGTRHNSKTPPIAFTLMEMMVAIAAVAVVSVGLAAMFTAVGRTVTGGRRVSVLNNYAALIESRMRRDFEAMTRDGVMVIRHQWVQKNPQPTISGIPFADNDKIPVDAEGRNARPRRSDEIMFFTRGDFESARQPLIPGVTARSNEARIYYGMGQRIRPDLNYGERYLVPRLYERNNYPDSYLGVPGGPNEFAGDWTLLRLETLLVDLETANPRPYQISTPPGLPAYDTDWQVGIQPAAASIFRRLALLPNTTPENIRFDHPLPMLSSGLVDVATSSLREVRMVILGMPAAQSGMGVLPNDVVPSDKYPSANYIGSSYRPCSPSPTPGIRPPQSESVDEMHMWMDQALPSDSAAARLPNTYYPCSSDYPGARVRYEPQPPDLFTAIDQQGVTAYEDAYERADQLMLASNNFLPRCSEFIVEWSFGITTLQNEVIWYGLPRWADLNGNGAIDGNDREMLYPYPYYGDGGASQYLGVNYTQVGNSTPQTHWYTERLIYGYDARAEPLASVLTTYFGYVDPTFPAPVDVDNDGQLDTGSPTVPTAPWPWPRMIRVTVTVSDAQDPAIENTFQFVFSTPKDPGLQQ